jgi:PAS domain S-box-containing protein
VLDQLEDFFMVKQAPYKELEKEVKELEDELTLSKRLNEKALLFKSVVDCSSEAIAIRNSTGRLIYINPAHEKLFGRSLDEAKSLTYRDYYPPESVKVLNGEVAPALERGESWEGVLDAFDANGRRFPLWERADTIRNANGEMQYCFGLMHDISKEKQAEKAVDESEARFRELTELLPESIYEMDLKGNLIFANRSGFDHFGYSQEDFDRGLNAFDLIVPEDRERGLENARKILQGEKIGLTEYTAMRKDGSTFPAMFRSAVIFHEEKPVGIRGFVIDITDRKRAEQALRKAHDELEQRVRERTAELENANAKLGLEIKERKLFEKALRESEVRYRILVESSPDVILSVSTEDGTIRSLNPAFEKITGWSSSDWIGKQYTSLIHPDDVPIAMEKYHQFLNGKVFPPVELRVPSKSGETLFGEFILEPEIKNSEMVGYFGFVRDITGRKKAERALAQKNKYNNLRADIWKLASDKSLEEDELIQKLLGRMGPVIGVSRACFNRFTGEDPKNSGLRCVIEWCDEGVKPSVGVTVPAFLVKYAIWDDFFVVTEETALEMMPKLLRAVAKPVISAIATSLNLESVLVLPYLLNQKLEGMLTFDVCKDKKDKVTWSEEMKSIVYEVVSIISSHISQKKTEEALKASEEKYRTILENIEDGYYEVDLAGNFTFFNDSMCRILGYSKDELTGKNNRQIMDQENAKKAYKTFNRVYTTGKPDKGTDWQIINKDGGKRHIEVSVSLIKDKKGDPIGFRGVSRDITRRKLSEQLLREREKELEFKTITLGETNTTLRVLLEKREKDKIEIEQTILSNVNELVMPYLERLKKNLSDETLKTYSSIIESNLSEIVSPFLQRLSVNNINLSPAQIQVANLVKDGKTTKQISELLSLSEKTIEDHRKGIRKKLGILNKKVNLKSHLLNFAQADSYRSAISEGS